MRNRLFRSCWFAIAHAWRTDRIGTATACIFIAIAGASGSAALFEYRDLQRSRDAYLAFSGTPGALSAVPQYFDGSQADLSPFRSHELLDTLNDAAASAELPINELAFRFDDNPMRPYLRYIVTIKVFGDYPAVRRFIGAARPMRPQTSLDAISCTRTDIRSAHLSCELTMSAFYRRGKNE